MGLVLSKDERWSDVSVSTIIGIASDKLKITDYHAKVIFFSFKSYSFPAIDWDESYLVSTNESWIRAESIRLLKDVRRHDMFFVGKVRGGFAVKKAAYQCRDEIWIYSNHMVVCESYLKLVKQYQQEIALLFAS